MGSRAMPDRGAVPVATVLVVLVAAAATARAGAGGFDVAAGMFSDPDRAHLSIVWAHTAPHPPADFEATPLRLRSIDNEEFTCYVPRDRSAALESDTLDEEPVAEPAVLLAPLADECILRFEVYWSYELCFGKNLRQFHETKVVTAKATKETKVTEYILGQHPADKTDSSSTPGSTGNTDPPTAPPTFLLEGKRVPYYAETYSDGEICDVTKQPRQTEIRFVCSGGSNTQHMFASIMETSSCNYVAVVLTSYLCKHPDYVIAAEEESHIHCLSSKHPDDPPQPLTLVEMEEDARAEQDERSARRAQENKIRTEQRLALQEQERQNKIRKSAGPTSGAGTTAGAGKKQPRQPADAGATGAAAAGGAGRSPAARDPEQVAQPGLSTEAAKKELRKFLRGSYCFSGGHGWWRFEFCPYKHVLQFHRHNSGEKDTIRLGTWNEAYHKAEYKRLQPDKRAKTFFTHFYKDGDYCEEVKRNRKVRVKMKCSQQFQGTQVSLSLEEPTVCEYVMLVESSLFCDLLQGLDEHGMPEL